MLAFWRRFTARHPVWVLAVFVFAFIYGTYQFYGRSHLDGGKLIRIGGDGRYYWAFLTSLALDGDIDFANQYANPRSGNYYGEQRTQTGRFANGAPIGPALVWMPAFFVVHAISRAVEPETPDDGTTSFIEQNTLYTSYLCGFAALILAYAAARKRYGPGPAVAGAIIAMAAGPVMHYCLNQADYSHAASALSVVALLFVWDAGRGQRTRRGWIFLGVLIGVSMLMRPQNIIFALPAVGEGAWDVYGAARRGGVRAVAQALVGPLLGLTAALIAFAPQLIAWEILYGQIGVPGGSASIRMSDSAWSETLFSSRNGLFPYAPAWLFGLFGLALVARRDRVLAAALLVTFVLITWLNGAFWHWWGQGSFGGRRFDGLVYAVALGTAAIARATIDGFVRWPRIAAGVVISCAATFMVFFTGGLSFEFQRHAWSPQPASTRMFDYYVRVGSEQLRAALGGTNPFSWPAAWAFALRTGAPVWKYDVAVGPIVLDGWAPAHLKVDATAKGEIVFATADSEAFVVTGFGSVRKDRQRPLLAPHARFLVPMNVITPVTFRLLGTASATGNLSVSWNGDEVAKVATTAGAPLDVKVELPIAIIKRNLNIVDLDFDAPKGTEFAVVSKAQFETPLEKWK